jgi:diguanylate cyclase (GGDEF)-like protein
MNYFVSRQSLRTSALTETLPLISDTIYSVFQSHLMRPVHNSSLMAHNTFLQDWVTGGEEDVEQVVQYLRGIKEEYGYFSTFLISENTGNYYYYDGILKQISPENEHDVWYYRFKELNADYDVEVDVDEATDDTLTIFINHRLEDGNGRFLGVTGVGLKMDNIGEILMEFQEKYNRLIYMADTDGLIQVHPDASLIEVAYLGGPHGVGALAETILAHKEVSPSYQFNRDGQHVYVSARYFPDLDWFLIVEQYEALAVVPLGKSLLGNLLVGLVATCVVLVIVAWSVNHYQNRLEILAMMDGLTGLYNRRHFLELCHREAAQARRYKHPISLVLFDADHFKEINDTYGHEEGDMFLAMLALSMRESLREIDILGRIGGEEFSALLPKASLEEARLAAERVRESMATKVRETAKGRAHCTVSAGVVCSEAGPIDVKELLKRADQAIYRAKDMGRNRVCTDEGEVVTGNG